MRFGIGRVDGQRFAVGVDGLRKPGQIVMDVAEVEVGLEAIGVQADRLLVERLGLDQLVALVVDVRQVHDGGHELRIEQRAPGGRPPPPLEIARRAIVEFGAFEEVLGRQGPVGGGNRLRSVGRCRRRRGRRRLRRQRHDARRRALGPAAGNRTPAAPAPRPTARAAAPAARRRARSPPAA